MAIIEANDRNFNEEIKEGLVLVDFWAVWCRPCKMIAPVLDDIAKDMEGTLKIVKLNVDDYQAVAKEFGIMSIPTLKVLKNGEEVDTITGFRPKEELQNILSQYVS